MAKVLDRRIERWAAGVPLIVGQTVYGFDLELYDLAELKEFDGLPKQTAIKVRKDGVESWGSARAFFVIQA